MTEKEIAARVRVIAYYRRIAKDWAPEKVREAYLQHAQRLENELRVAQT